MYMATLSFLCTCNIILIISSLYCNRKPEEPAIFAFVDANQNFSCQLAKQPLLEGIFFLYIFPHHNLGSYIRKSDNFKNFPALYQYNNVYLSVSPMNVFRHDIVYFYHFMCMRISTIFTKADNFCDFLLAFLHAKAIPR